MMFDFDGVARKCALWSSEAVVIAAAATRLEKSLVKLEPTAKAALAADYEAARTSWTALDAAFHAYDTASNVSKIAALVAVFNTVAKTTPLLTRIARDGESLYAADWPVVQPDVHLLLSKLQGSST